MGHECFQRSREFQGCALTRLLWAHDTRKDFIFESKDRLPRQDSYRDICTLLRSLFSSYQQAMAQQMLRQFCQKNLLRHGLRHLNHPQNVLASATSSNIRKKNCGYYFSNQPLTGPFSLNREPLVRCRPANNLTSKQLVSFGGLQVSLYYPKTIAFSREKPHKIVIARRLSFACP